MAMQASAPPRRPKPEMGVAPAWWPIADSEELARHPRAFRLGIRDLAVYRDLQGPVCAVDDARRRASSQAKVWAPAASTGARGIGEAGDTPHLVWARATPESNQRPDRLDVLQQCRGDDILWVGPDRRDGPATEVQTDACEQILRGGVTGAMWGCRYAIPAMAAGRGGSIISISTAAASRAARGLAGHSASRPRSRRSRDRWLSTLRRRASAPTHSPSASSPTAADTRRCWRTRRWCRRCAIGS